MKAVFTIEVSGESAVKRVRNLLHTLATISNWGASRSIKFDWDGDGQDKLNYEEKESHFPSFTSKDIDKALNYPALNVLTSGVKGCKLEVK